MKSHREHFINYCIIFLGSTYILQLLSFYLYYFNLITCIKENTDVSIFLGGDLIEIQQKN